MTKIKICGLFREEDIGYVNEARPDYAGFILNYPKSHRSLTIRQADRLKSQLSEKIRAVGVLVDQPLETAIQAAARIQPAVLQLHGRENEEYIRRLRAATGLEIWKVFQVRDPSGLEAARSCGADAVLLDNGYGSGQVFDWSAVSGFDRPFILAGGLTPENICEAIKCLHPAVVDLSSGVETGRLKDREKILAVIQAVRSVQS